MHRLALIVAVCAVAPSALAGPCMPSSMVAAVQTPPNATIAKGGGILVGTASKQGDGKRPADDPSNDATWRFEIGGKLVAPTRTLLAPGLTVFAVPAGATAVELDDAQRARQVSVTVGGDAPLLAAPKPAKARYVETTFPSYRGPATTRTVQLDLAAPPPADAFALIVYGDGVARDWFAVDATTKTLAISHQSQRCEGFIPGRTESSAGNQLTFAWVDRSGRLSPQSPAITVGK